jgi:ABC-type Mn2+/Zn2+ transport system ATPase subunit
MDALAETGIRVENLSVGYEGRAIVEGLNFKMEEGEFWLVVGPNGSGKSTLIKTITGIIPPIRGKIFIHGVDCSEDCEERRFFGYVPQTENYLKDFPATAFDVVLSGIFGKTSKTFGVPDSAVETAEYWLKEFELWEVRNKRFSELSGGQQKKVLIARALMGDPHYVFLDEPTTGVDLKSSRRILEIINELHKEKKFGICMVTHELTLVWPYVDNVILLSGGRFFVGSKEEIVDKHLLTEFYGVDVEVPITEHGPVFLVGDKHN